MLFETAGSVATLSETPHSLSIGDLLHNEQILEEMPDGVVLLDGGATRFAGRTAGSASGVMRADSGHEFLRGLGQPRNPGPRLLSLPHRA